MAFQKKKLKLVRIKLLDKTIFQLCCCCRRRRRRRRCCCCCFFLFFYSLFQCVAKWTKIFKAFFSKLIIRLFFFFAFFLEKKMMKTERSLSFFFFRQQIAFTNLLIIVGRCGQGNFCHQKLRDNGCPPG